MLVTCGSGRRSVVLMGCSIRSPGCRRSGTACAGGLTGAVEALGVVDHCIIGGHSWITLATGTTGGSHSKTGSGTGVAPSAGPPGAGAGSVEGFGGAAIPGNIGWTIQEGAPGSVRGIASTRYLVWSESSIWRWTFVKGG